MCMTCVFRTYSLSMISERERERERESECVVEKLKDKEREREKVRDRERKRERETAYLQVRHFLISSVCIHIHNHRSPSHTNTMRTRSITSFQSSHIVRMDNTRGNRCGASHGECVGSCARWGRSTTS